MTRLGMTVVEAMDILQVVTAKSWSARGASFHPAFMSNCLTISHTCYHYLHSRRVTIGPFEVICRARLQSWGRWTCRVVTFQGEKFGNRISFCGNWFVHTGNREVCTKGEQVNWWVSLPACSSRNPAH